MLVASRDPFHLGAHGASFSQSPGTAAAHAGGVAPRFARAMSVLQIVGTLLAIPVGIGSAYSMYRANFSVETTCQSLRVNIVAMLDKSVDASTRHMLVRRDVEAFEHSCGGVDPDATAAFKALLAADKAAAPVATATARRAEVRPEAMARKAEPRPEVAERQPAASTTAVTAETEPVQRDASASDAVWLAAVRRALVTEALVTPALVTEALVTPALVTHVADPLPAADGAEAIAATPPPPAIRPIARDIHAVSDGRAQAVTLAAPAPISAPALPPPTSVAIASPRQSDADHPVPPAPIPEMASLPKEANATTVDGRTRSRLGELVAQIPLVGWALDR
jgi:hypothetical protein